MQLLKISQYLRSKSKILFWENIIKQRKQAKYTWEKVQAGNSIENWVPQEVGRGGVGFRGIGGEVRGLYGQQGFFCSPSVLPSSNDADPRCLPLSPPTPSLGKTGICLKLLDILFSCLVSAHGKMRESLEAIKPALKPC